MCHFLERYLSQHLKPSGIAIANEKDFLLHALGDVIILEELTTPGGCAVFKVWQAGKTEGGLGWINPKRLAAFQERFTG